MAPRRPAGASATATYNVLPKLPLDFSYKEICSYFGVYLLYMAYGFYAIASARPKILQMAPEDQFVNDSWPFVQSPHDSSNTELENFTHFIQYWWPWYLVHATVSVSYKIFQLHHVFELHKCQAIVCAVALCYMLKPLTIACLAALLVSFYATTFYNSKIIIWQLAAGWMIVLHTIKVGNYVYYALGYREFFIFILILSWSVLRCLSYTLNCLDDRQKAKTKDEVSIYSWDKFLGYTLYLPTVIYGPLMGYPRYAVLFDKQPSATGAILHAQIWNFVYSLLRTLVWWLFMNYLLHFLYVHYMAYDVQAVVAVGGPFEQHAVGYFMGQMFFMFYVVTYGLGIAFAKFDELNPPQKPRCIGRVHFYSNMWKYFDEGLYEFLFKHIYCELRGGRKSLSAKLCATAATFAFVYVWHGCYAYILIWSILNFMCLVAEKLFVSIVSSPVYQQCFEENISPMTAQRIRAICATQLFIPAAFSNIYFISGQDVGNLLMGGAYLSGFFNYIILTICSYCFFQCSEILTDYLDN